MKFRAINKMKACVKKIVSLLPIRLRQFIRYNLARIGIYQQINSRLRLVEEANLPEDLRITLKQMAILGTEKVENFLKSYLANDIELIKRREQTEIEEPILVCAVKNDLNRIKMQIEHHRKLGIIHFIYIDNVSTDGTFEWLNEQNDVTLYRVKAPYDSATRNGWWHRAVENEGYGKWYLFLDSDELFVYPGMENANIQKYIGFLEMKKINITTTPLIDMYSPNKIFESVSYENVKDVYCFFDIKYLQERQYTNWVTFGGPRLRIFSYTPQLTKHSLLKMEKNYVVDSHKVYPFHKNTETGVTAFLLHYKFLFEDIEKTLEAIKKENYYHGSKSYKTYMKFYKQNSNISFYNSDSQKLNSSMDLLKINIIDKNFFEEFLNWIQLPSKGN